jgi:hypothetical protein
LQAADSNDDGLTRVNTHLKKEILELTDLNTGLESEAAAANSKVLAAEEAVATTQLELDDALLTIKGLEARIAALEAQSTTPAPVEEPLKLPVNEEVKDVPVQDDEEAVREAVVVERRSGLSAVEAAKARKKERAEAKRVEAEAEAKRLAEAEAAFEEAEAKRLAEAEAAVEEAEAKRLAEAETKRLAEAEAAVEEAEAKRLAEAEAEAEQLAEAEAAEAERLAEAEAEAAAEEPEAERLAEAADVATADVEPSYTLFKVQCGRSHLNSRAL